VFTFVSGGSKRVVVSGYDAIYRLLVKNADHTSARSTASMTPTIKMAVQKTPGSIPYTCVAFGITILSSNKSSSGNLN